MVTILHGRRLASRLLAHRPRIAPQVRTAVAAPFQYEELFDLHANEVPTQYRKLSSDGVSTCTLPSGEKLLKVESEVLESLSHQAIVDIQHLFRPAHLEMLSNILKDPEASSNDRFVALELLKNACAAWL
ncbi:fumA [Symbiodinium natans]|uniref:FumA protein n=1 Tax=Symbiodinium natans TaxID=878477 RepID=A0A812SCA9_9DINO|nr:fumA [Symbiodinium natans]